MGVSLSAAPAQAQADFTIVSRNHAAKTVTVQATVVLSVCSPTGLWRFTWGDGSHTDIGHSIIAGYSHTYADWGTYTVTLSYKCHSRNAKSTARSITLTKPVEPTDTPTPIPNLGLSFNHLSFANNRVYVLMQSTIPLAQIICSFSGAASGSFYCSNGTLVSVRLSTCGTVTVTARGTFGDQTATVTNEVEAPCAPTDTPVPPAAGAAYIGVASQNDPNRSVAVNISHTNCTGTGTWSTDWGDGESDDIPSPYSGRFSHSYADWGVFDIELAYACSGNPDTAEANVALAHPTPTPTGTPVRAAVELAQGAQRADTRAERHSGASAPYPTQDHSCLPAGASVRSDTPWIAFCEVSGAAISNPAVRKAAMSAIDVWGPLGVAAEVCFAGDGSLLLLDTAYSPRHLVWLNAYQRGGRICAYLDRAGTVVLMPDPLTATPTARPTATPTRDPYLIADDPNARKMLPNCTVTSDFWLNLRERPVGRIIGLYLGDAPAIGRTDNWYQVMQNDQIGWISAHYVNRTEGDCD